MQSPLHHQLSSHHQSRQPQGAVCPARNAGRRALHVACARKRDSRGYLGKSASPSPSSTSGSSSTGSSSSAGGDPVSREILQAFFYGRALAVTLNKRLSEVVVDAISEVSKSVAERPQRLKAFQDEVAALARKEMQEAGALVPDSQATTAGSGGALAGSNGKAGETDVRALIDDLRAEIAYSRASLQQIKQQQAKST